MIEPIDIFNVEPHVVADAVADSLHGEHTGFARKALTGYITHALAKHRYTEVMSILHNADTETVWPFMLLGALVKPTRYEYRSLYDTIEEQGVTRDDLLQIWLMLVKSVTYISSVDKWAIRILLRNGDRYMVTFKDSDVEGWVMNRDAPTYSDLQMSTLWSTNALGRLITLTTNLFIRSVYATHESNVPGVDIHVQGSLVELGNMLNCMVAVESNHLKALTTSF